MLMAIKDNAVLTHKTAAMTHSNTIFITSGLLLATLLLGACMGTQVASDASTRCPQQRLTEMASAYIAARANPLPVNADNIAAGEKKFKGEGLPVACTACHGDSGAGNGAMAKMFSPPPRNFTCASTMGEIPDGQLFWIIKNGSIGTSMPAYNTLSDDTLWQLVMYVRKFSQQTTHQGQ
jgi:mono/diheme cytochrome c family protein